MPAMPGESMARRNREMLLSPIGVSVPGTASARRDHRKTPRQERIMQWSVRYSSGVTVMAVFVQKNNVRM
jgi:hypothetical protein